MVIQDAISKLIEEGYDVSFGRIGWEIFVGVSTPRRNSQDEIIGFQQWYQLTASKFEAYKKIKQLATDFNFAGWKQGRARIKRRRKRG